MAIIKMRGDWKQLAAKFRLEPADIIDLHFGPRDPCRSYHEVMMDLEMMVERNLITAQKNRRPYLMFVHGWSTSRRGNTTARSVVRSFMRSKAATPLIMRSGCVQHETVFVAKIRLPALDLHNKKSSE
jgi:hypothetical protein